MQPNSPEIDARFDLDADTAVDLAACRALLRQGSKSFFTASLLLPRRVRDPASALYAFCRLADDAIDLSADPRAALGQLRYRLDRTYAGAPLPCPVDRAFAAVVGGHAIPRAVPEALIEGFAWDVERRTYQTLAELEAYAVRVAGTVGVMMTLLMGERDASVLARACDLGVAMQLTNIARDVGEDARAGRLYLPLDWLEDAGVSPRGFLDAPAHSAALGTVIWRLLDVAATYYVRADAGIARLPADCRPAIRAASLIYAGIGRRIAALDYDVLDRRTVVSRAKKLRLIARACLPAHIDARHLTAHPIASACDIIAASAATRPSIAPSSIHNSPFRPSIYDAAVRLIDLFERLERRSLAARSDGGH